MKLKRLIIRIIYVFILGMAISACSTKTAHTEYGDVELLSANSIVDKMIEVNEVPEYLSANLKVKYTNKKSKLTFNAQLRIISDSTIWVNVSFFGISVARAMVEPDGVKMYERQNKSYFDGDFEYLSELLGIELNYAQLQSLLLGKAIQDLNGRNFDSEIQQNSFLLEYKKNKKLTRRAENNGDYFQRYWVNPINYELERQIVALPDRSNTLIVKNENFETVDKKYKIPENISLQIVNESVTLVEIEYKGVKTGEITSLPFRIPSSYKEIKLK